MCATSVLPEIFKQNGEIFLPNGKNINFLKAKTASGNYEGAGYVGVIRTLTMHIRVRNTNKKRAYLIYA